MSAQDKALWAKLKAVAEEFGETSKEVEYIKQELKEIEETLDRGKRNTPPEKRNPFSIWNIKHVHVTFPPTLSARQAVELLSNGHCGD